MRAIFVAALSLAGGKRELAEAVVAAAAFELAAVVVGRSTTGKIQRWKAAMVAGLFHTSQLQTVRALQERFAVELLDLWVPWSAWFGGCLLFVAACYSADNCWHRHRLVH